MRVIERTVLVTATGVVVVAGLVAGVAVAWRGFYFPFSEGMLAVATSAAGAIITRSQPRHAVGRSLLWAGLVLALAQLAAAFAPASVSDPTAVAGLWGVVVSMFQFSSLGLLLALIARFPDGDWTTPWSRRLYGAAIAAVGMHVAILAWVAIGGGSRIPGGPALLPFRLFPLIGVVLMVHVVVHLLRSDPTRRRQIAWVLAAFVLALVPEAVIEVLDLDVGPIGGVVRGLLVLLIPASVVVAVTRFRLYEIDRVLSRTISYALVIGAMLAVFGVVSLMLGVTLGGADDLTVAIATLVSVFVAVPLFGRVRRWVDQRFFRYRYDSAAVVARVADDLRTTVDLAEVESRTVAVVDEVFSPESVGVWLEAKA